MEPEEEIIEKGEVPTPEGKSSTTIDIGELYRFKPEDLSIEILGERYSNLAYIQVTHRDVHIDFLSTPGVKKDGKMVLPGIRVFMSHVAAQKIAEALGQLLEDIHSKGKMETYRVDEKEKSKLSTKNTRTTKEEMV
jgi:hypothetical protein